MEIAHDMFVFSSFPYALLYSLLKQLIANMKTVILSFVIEMADKH